MRIAIIGSRGITTIDLSQFVPPDCTLIVSGGARGVDTIAEHYAKAHNIPTLIIKPDYDRYGRSAPIRSNDITCHCLKPCRRYQEKHLKEHLDK